MTHFTPSDDCRMERHCRPSRDRHTDVAQSRAVTVAITAVTVAMWGPLASIDGFLEIGVTFLDFLPEEGDKKIGADICFISESPH